MDSKHEIAFTGSRPDLEKGSIEKRDNPQSISGWGKSRLWAVETTGIQRVTDEDRAQNTTHVWNACTFWYEMGRSAR